MNEPTPAPTPPAVVYAEPWAVRLGFALIAAFTLILGLVFLDRTHRRELETTSEATAVGDAHFLPPEQIAAWQLTPFEVRDTHVTKASRDDPRGSRVYVLTEAATAGERSRVGAQRLLKSGVNQYVLAPPGLLGK